MDTKTRRVLIIVCVLAFILTSTFTWGVISAGMDAAQAGVEAGREAAGWTVAWILANATLLVPVFFLGGIIWLVRMKTKG